MLNLFQGHKNTNTMFSLLWFFSSCLKKTEIKILTDWWIKGISCAAANLLEKPVLPSGMPKFNGSRFLIMICKSS